MRSNLLSVFHCEKDTSETKQLNSDGGFSPAGTEAKKTTPDHVTVRLVMVYFQSRGLWPMTNTRPGGHVWPDRLLNPALRVFTERLVSLMG